MLRGVDPLLNKIEALAELGCYSLTFAVDSGEERAVVLRIRPDEQDVPGANLFSGWSAESFAATVAAVRALDEARALVGPVQAQLRDIEGGWDVGLGNVILNPDGAPACVAHGELETTEPGIFRCPVCGAAAGYQN